MPTPLGMQPCSKLLLPLLSRAGQGRDWGWEAGESRPWVGATGDLVGRGASVAEVEAWGQVVARAGPWEVEPQGSRHGRTLWGWAPGLLVWPGLSRALGRGAPGIAGRWQGLSHEAPGQAGPWQGWSVGALPSPGVAKRWAAALMARTRSACTAMSASTSAWICSRSSTPCRCFPKSCDCSRPCARGGYRVTGQPYASLPPSCPALRLHAAPGLGPWHPHPPRSPGTREHKHCD